MTNPSDARWLEGDDAFPAEGESLTGDARTEARLCAVQALFSAHTMQLDATEAAAEMLADVKARNADKTLFAAITGEAAEGAARYETMIAAHTVDEWPLERMDPVHYAVLWAAAAELTARPETPVAVVINEFMTVAKGFAPQPQDVGYINAVLDRMAGKIRG